MLRNILKKIIFGLKTMLPAGGVHTLAAAPARHQTFSLKRDNIYRSEDEWRMGRRVGRVRARMEKEGGVKFLEQR